MEREGDRPRLFEGPKNVNPVAAGGVRDDLCTGHDTPLRETRRERRKLVIRDSENHEFTALDNLFGTKDGGAGQQNIGALSGSVGPGRHPRDLVPCCAQCVPEHRTHAPRGNDAHAHARRLRRAHAVPPNNLG